MRRKGRVSMEKLGQILQMREKRRSIRTIARCLHMSRKTVKKYLQENLHKECLNKNIQYQTHSPNDKLNPDDIPNWAQEIDIELVLKELGKGISYKVLYEELKPTISYFSFWRFFRKLYGLKRQNISIRIIHKPGEKTYVDFCDGIQIFDELTGEVIKTHLFVATLPFSQYTFAEFTLDQKLETFIELHDKTWEFFGGVTDYTVPDNLKSAVSKAHRYDPDCNKSFCEYANHVGFAVLPARPYKPRDKASVEGNIHHIQKSFFQRVRNKKYQTLFELNQDFKIFLKEFNNSIMKDYGVSRKERFSTEEAYLKAVPAEKFQLFNWKIAKVHPDCHIQVEKNFYSVPFHFAGKEVRVRYSKNYLEVFSSNGELLSSHKKIKGIGKSSTDPGHWPQEKQRYLSFDINKAKLEAKKIGENTYKLIDFLFSQSHPLRFLRPVQGMLRLVYSNKFNKEDMEYAAKMAFSHKIYRLSYITDCCIFHVNGGAKPRATQAPIRTLNTIHLHQSKEKIFN
ncbi:IS21 family transposase [Spirobacillus cienkowskii]|uniref:IS21 family transposase n=1 Tax=Spirobacillus cienkowskii TaxID=495820 RepID=UPI0030CC7E9A